jgi:hypothetical protein
MKNYLVFIAILQAAIFSSASAQVSDDFSDGNFIENPLWIGDSGDFIVNDANQLQLSAPAAASQSHLATASNISLDAEWSFSLKMEFNPSSNNYLDVYLISDQENLKDPLNGYFVRIGNTQDEVSLYRQSGEKSSALKIIDGVDKQLDVRLVEIAIKVTRGADRQWELLLDLDLSGNYVSSGSAVDDEHIFSRYFGLICTYTSSRSTKFYFDDLFISGVAFNDSEPPQADSIVVVNDSTVQIFFNESLEELSASERNNYVVNNGIGNPQTAFPDSDTTVSLIFTNKFQDKLENQISIHGVHDLYGNALNNYVAAFTYYAPYLIQFGDIIVSEIMADPTPEVDLPGYEFLEILNTTSELLEVTDMYLVVGADSIPVPDFSIDPKTYLVLCQRAALSEFARYGLALNVPNWPSLNNRGERISLYNMKGELIFTVDYDDSWYQSIEKDEGGWSLEMIDVHFPCKGRENWKASTAPSGGTPGNENASKDQLTDLSAPEISNIIAINEHEILIELNEKLVPVALELSQVATNPNLPAESVMLVLPDLNRINVVFSEPILRSTSYQLTLKGLEDCLGNRQSETSKMFLLPTPADSLDVLINEILFNPWPDGVDFVELYNQSEKYIDLNGWSLGNKDSVTITSEHFVVEPMQFLVLTEDFETLNNHYPGIDENLVLEVGKLTPFNDDEGTIRLMDADKQAVDLFQYSEDYHSPFIRDPEGVSLERISFEGASNSQDNWQSASESVGFATPGKMNSQYFANPEGSDKVTVEPQVFDPGNVGTNNFTLIKCRFDQPGNMASIKVLDGAGRIVKTIANHQSIGMEENFKWEGENDNGAEVRMGYYIVYLEVYNADGSRKIYRKKVVVGGRM